MTKDKAVEKGRTFFRIVLICGLVAMIFLGTRRIIPDILAISIALVIWIYLELTRK